MKKGPLCLLALLCAATCLAAEKTESIVKSFPTSPGKVVLVDAGALDLTVRSAEINEIRLTVDLAAVAFKESQARAWVEGHRPTISDTSEQLTIHAADPAGMNLFRGVVITRAKMELVVPLGVRPDLSTTTGTIHVEGAFQQAKPLRLRSASGEVNFAGWAPEAEVRSTSGDLTIQASRAFDRLLLRTASGQIELAGGAHAVRCDSSSGTVHLEGLLGAASIATTSGNIMALFDALPADTEVRVSSSSGRVRIVLPPGSEPGGELVSARGEIRSNYAGQAPDPKEARLVLAGSTPKIYVTTTSGRIDLE
jgi:Toastrack DUF4097